MNDTQELPASEREAGTRILDLVERSRAIAELADRIELSIWRPRRVEEMARLYFTEEADPMSTESCVVCGVALHNNEQGFCWGHWDYIVVRVPYPGATGQRVADDVRSLVGLRALHVRPYWLGTIKGKFPCSICDVVTGIHEYIVNADNLVVRSHCVCVDHATFRGLVVDNHVNELSTR